MEGAWVFSLGGFLMIIAVIGFVAKVAISSEIAVEIMPTIVIWMLFFAILLTFVGA